MTSTPILGRLSTALAVATLVSLVAGALIAGVGSPLGLSAAHSPWLRLHNLAAGAVIGLALITVAKLLQSDVRKWLKSAGLVFLALLAATALLGMLPRGAATGVAHAVSSHVLFALAVLLSLGTSPGWNRAAAPMIDRGWPSLRSLAWLTPVAVLVQIGLGAGFRYQALSSMPHAAWAFPAMLIILMLAAFTLSAASPDEHAELRKASIALMTLVCIQLILGVVAFLARMDPPLTFLPVDALAALRATHLGTGALVFGFTVALSAQILRCAVPVALSEPAQASEQWVGNGRRK